MRENKKVLLAKHNENIIVSRQRGRKVFYVSLAAVYIFLCVWSRGTERRRNKTEGVA